jgi:hypothetical protein
MLAACGSPTDEDMEYSDSTQELAANVTLSGANAADVSPTLTGTGFIKVVNNGAHVAVTETGSGTINIVIVPAPASRCGRRSTATLRWLALPRTPQRHQRHA